MTPMQHAMEKMHREFRELSGILIGGTNTNTVMEESPLTVETIMKAFDSLPPPLPPSPIPTEFKYAPHMPKHIGLIISNDTQMPVGILRWVDYDNVDITVMHNATNTYAQCGLDVYETIMQRLSKSGLDGLSPLSVYKEVDI